MAYFNLQDFFKAAGAVAQGQMQGKLQAQEEQIQRRQQETQQAFQMQQLGQQADDAQFAGADANDQFVQANVLPRLKEKDRTTLIEQMGQNRAQRDQQRAKNKLGRMGLLPPWMQAFMTPSGPAGVNMPVTQTQPGMTSGPAGTVQQAATGQVIPGAGMETLPTTPAGAPPGAAPPSLALNMPPMGFPPQAPPPMAAPPVAPPVAPVAPPAPTPTRHTIQIPGYPGAWETTGITDKDLKDYEADRKATKDLITNFNGPADIKAKMQSAWNRASQNPGDENELATARAALSEAEQYRASGGATAYAQRRLEQNDAKSDVEKHVKILTDTKTNPRMAGLQVERILAIQDASGIPPVDGAFPGFDDKIAEYQKAKAAGKGDRANAIAGEIAGALRNNLSPEDARSRSNNILKTAASLSMRDRKDPKKLAAALRAQGDEPGAQQVEKEGFTGFGGYQADKAFQSWLQDAPKWSQMQDRTAWLQQGARLGEAAGMKPSEIQQVLDTNLDQKAKPMTAYEKTLVTKGEKMTDLAYKRFEFEKQKHKDDQQYRDRVLNKEKSGATVSVKLRGLQHDVDAASNVLQKLRTDFPFSDTDIDAADINGTSKQSDIKRAEARWKERRAAWATVYTRELGVNPDSGDVVGKPGSAQYAPAGKLKPVNQMGLAEAAAELAKEAAKMAAKGKR